MSEPKDPKEETPFRWYAAADYKVKVTAERAKRLLKAGERISPNPRMSAKWAESSKVE